MYNRPTRDWEHLNTSANIPAFMSNRGNQSSSISVTNGNVKTTTGRLNGNGSNGSQPRGRSTTTHAPDNRGAAPFFMPLSHQIMTEIRSCDIKKNAKVAMKCNNFYDLSDYSKTT